MNSDIVTFKEAIEDSGLREGGRSVLLGNGFSVDWNYDTFAYHSLYEEASFNGLSVDKTMLFDLLGTRDFERVIENLRSAANLADLYESGSGELATALRSDADSVMHALSSVLADKHPYSSQDLDDIQVEFACSFLSNFGRIFTLNYDLLLYWVLNRIVGDHVPNGDGFEWPTANSPGQLVWKYSAAERGQRIFYLHGAFHLFMDGPTLNKLRYTWAEPLIDQIRSRLSEEKYPFVVTEGKSEEKQARIEGNAYLRYCHSRLGGITGSLFFHGLSMSPNDDHILRSLEAKESQVDALYVSFYGDPDGDENAGLSDRARKVVRRRRNKGGRDLHLSFYDSESAHVWR